ncbi:hypothetical protein J2X55_002146 [Microbacterium sp. 1154]|nr:hypothetical protein [Microbacterium sp. 1154]
MIRLDSAAPPLWRSDGSVQFGAPAVAVSPFTGSWVDVVVAALADGTSPTAVRGLARVHGARDGEADVLLAAVAPALARRTRHPPLALQVDDDLSPRAARAVLAALPPRTRVISWAGTATETVAPATRVVLLAAHRVDPRRAGALVRDDVTHLPLVLDGSSARIGPVIAPGRTACLACLDADQRRDDPDWATVAAQLVGRARPDVDVALAAEAGRAARFLLTAPIEQTTRSLRLRADSFRRAWALHRPSADCHCRSLGGSETETVPSALDPAPSSPTACAQPA